MKIVTWNCAMALDKKFEVLSILDCDLMVIQECSRKSIERINAYEGYSAVWYGENKNKGLGIVARSPWKIIESRELGLKWILHSVVTGPIKVDLIGVWTHKTESRETRYIRQVLGLIDILESSERSENIILLGDFNSNSIWDLDYNGSGHSLAVERLSNLSLYSAYHKYFNEEHGQETRPTLYFRKRKSSAFHIDYIFLSSPLIQSLKSSSKNLLKSLP
ncbi:MAG TPA: endonuclease/exonuclease/phosphatase family protein [Allocoleopsis sp.]